MLKYFQDIALPSMDAGHVLQALAVAGVCSLMIALLYRWTYRGNNYSPPFVRSIIFLAMITAVVMLVIGNNLARAFGLVGAMSIIRFRTAVKDVQDIVFIFFALAIGLASGVGLHIVAFVGTLVICLTIAVTSLMNLGAVHKEEFVLHLSYFADEGMNGHASYVPSLNRYCKTHKLINARSAGSGGNELELTFYVRLRDKKQVEVLTRELGHAPHVRNVNLFYDEEPA